MCTYLYVQARIHAYNHTRTHTLPTSFMLRKKVHISVHPKAPSLVHNFALCIPYVHIACTFVNQVQMDLSCTQKTMNLCMYVCMYD